MAEKILSGNDIMLLGAIGLNQQMLPVLLVLMFAAALAWFFVSSRFYAELRRNYPVLYESLGSPSLFMKKSLTVNVRVIEFLFKQDSSCLLEPEILRMCQGLRALFCIYIVCLAGCLILLLDKLG